MAISDMEMSCLEQESSPTAQVVGFESNNNPTLLGKQNHITSEWVVVLNIELLGRKGRVVFSAKSWP